MATITITKSWPTGTTLTESLLDTLKSEVETFFNTTQINDDNIQSGVIQSEKYAAGSVNATALGSSAVTTEKLADGAVTQAKRASLGQQLSSSSSTFNTSSASLVDVTNLSCTITTTGRPVQIVLVPDGSNLAYIRAYNGSATSNVAATFQLLRDSTEINRVQVVKSFSSSIVTDNYIPPSTIRHIDVPSAGTYTYKLKVSTNTNVNVYYCKLLVYEL